MRSFKYILRLLTDVLFSSSWFGVTLFFLNFSPPLIFFFGSYLTLLRFFGRDVRMHHVLNQFGMVYMVGILVLIIPHDSYRPNDVGICICE